MTRVRTRWAGRVAVVLLTILSGTPAAASDFASVTGNGTIWPPLPTTGCSSQLSVTFLGNAVLVGTHAGAYSVRFDGSSSICESLASGSGSGTLSGGVTGNVTYSRTDTVVALTGSVHIGGATHTIQAGDCLFVPTSIPVGSFALKCELVLV